MTERNIRLTVDKEELKALISHHSIRHGGKFDVETSSRIHDLTKRLNRDTPEVEQQPEPEAKPNTSGGW